MPRNKKQAGNKPDTNVQVSADDSGPREDVATEDTKKYTKRRISSNWAKYERDIDAETPDQLEDDRDFKFLERNTNSTNFFQLDEEKEWEKSRLTPDHGLFSLNVKQLTAGISCVPFYEVLDIDKEFITPESVYRCDKIAKNNVLRYRQDYPSDQGNKTEPVQETVVTEQVKEKDTPPAESEDDELEEWLDSVLDN